MSATYFHAAHLNKKLTLELMPNQYIISFQPSVFRISSCLGYAEIHIHSPPLDYIYVVIISNNT
jgi:hypothetical protein